MHDVYMYIIYMHVCVWTCTCICIYNVPLTNIQPPFWILKFQVWLLWTGAFLCTQNPQHCSFLSHQVILSVTLATFLTQTLMITLQGIWPDSVIWILMCQFLILILCPMTQFRSFEKYFFIYLVCVVVAVISDQMASSLLISSILIRFILL